MKKGFSRSTDGFISPVRLHMQRAPLRVGVCVCVSVSVHACMCVYCIYSALNLRHIVQAVEDVLPGLLRLDRCLSFMVLGCLWRQETDGPFSSHETSSSL